MVKDFEKDAESPRFETEVVYPLASLKDMHGVAEKLQNGPDEEV